jgi:hypothetical protein
MDLNEEAYIATVVHRLNRLVQVVIAIANVVFYAQRILRIIDLLRE